MKIPLTAFVIAVFVAAIVGLYTRNSDKPHQPSYSTSNPNPSPNNATRETTAIDDQGFDESASLQQSVDESSPPTLYADALAVELVEEQSSSSQKNNVQTELYVDSPELYGYEVALSDFTDETFLKLINRLKNDPYLVSELVNELRIETDPARAKRLTALLGEVGGGEILLLAEELVYSSTVEARSSGLELLSRVATKDASAYDIAVNILSSEADAGVLVSTMNVLATPINASTEIKASAVSQIIPLAEHESAAVRRHSIALSSRLSEDESLLPVFTNALSDEDESVRSAAIYAYAKLPHQPPEAVDRLISISEDVSETDLLRKSAIYALERKPLSEEIVLRIRDAKMQMRDVALQRRSTR